MDAGVRARDGGAEEAAGAPSSPLLSPAPAQRAPSSPLRSAAAAPSSPLRSAAAAPSSPLRSAAAAPSSPPRSPAAAPGAPSSPLRSATPPPVATSPSTAPPPVAPSPSAAPPPVKPSAPLRFTAPPLVAPLASDASGGSEGRAVRDLCHRVVERIVAGGRMEASAFDLEFYAVLANHFVRFPRSYHLYVSTVNAENVITHMKLMDEARNLDRCPAIHVQFLRAEELIVETTTNRDDVGDTFSTRPELTLSCIHEIVFGYVHNPWLLSKLSAIISELGMNVKQVHAFSTKDGFCLCAFTVQGWPTENIIGLAEALNSSISTNESILCSSGHGTPKSKADLSCSSSNYATAPQAISLARNDRSQTRKHDKYRRLHVKKMRRKAAKLQQQKMMESFRAILSDSISFLFPAMFAIFTSSFHFHNSEKTFLITIFSMGGLLILLNMVLSHGVEDGPGRTAVVSLLTLLTVIYVFGVFEYFLYKFYPAGEYQVTALHCIAAHFIFGALMLKWLWETSFKTS